MGASNFEAWSNGQTMAFAYDRAVKSAREEHGDDPYNGTISTTSGFQDVTEKYRSSKKPLDKFIGDSLDQAQKWGPCLGICIEPPKENKNKIRTTVEHYVNKGTLHWILKYSVYEVNGDNRKLASRDTKGEAVDFARKHTADTRKETYVIMEKILESGMLTVAYVKYKPSPDERTGKYVFFGWAAT